MIEELRNRLNPFVLGEIIDKKLENIWAPTLRRSK
jgi:hypothetical protein